METTTARRPLKSRQTLWARAFASSLAKSGISPNMISFLSMVFAGLALLAALSIPTIGTRAAALLVALCIQARLLCNLMDGMVAVEFGKKSKTGDLWNDVPDRLADVFLILSAGYFALHYFEVQNLAWANATLAVLTAYLRVLGASLKSPHYFLGPMAKPHRMALLTVALLAEAVYPGGLIVYSALWIMLIGQIVTCGRRLNSISKDLETK